MFKQMSPVSVARMTLAFIFIYQGLVPKLIFLDPVELYMDQKHLTLLPVLNFISPQQVAQMAGVTELVLGVLIVVLPRRKWPVQLAFAALLLLLLDVVIVAPELLTGAFNPVISNLAGMALGWIALQRDSQTVRIF